jgi:hypothetical protein
MVMTAPIPIGPSPQWPGDLVDFEYGSPAEPLLRHPSANSRLQERATAPSSGAPQTKPGLRPGTRPSWTARPLHSRFRPRSRPRSRGRSRSRIARRAAQLAIAMSPSRT